MKQRDRDILALYEQGYSNTEVAAKLGLTKGVVSGVVYRAGKGRGRGDKTRADDQRDLDILYDLQEGHSQHIVAARFKVSRTHIAELVSAWRAAA